MLVSLEIKLIFTFRCFKVNYIFYRKVDGVLSQQGRHLKELSKFKFQTADRRCIGQTSFSSEVGREESTKLYMGAYDVG